MGMSQQAGHCKKPVSPMNTRAALEVVRNIAWTIVLLTSTAVTGASGINRLSVYLGDNAVMTCPNVINITMVTWKISPKTGGQCSLSYLNGHKTERTNCSDRINWRSRPEWDQALEIQQVEMADEGNYTCEVVNADGGFHHHYHLTVLVSPRMALYCDDHGNPVCEAETVKPAAEIWWVPESNSTPRADSHDNGTVTVVSRFTAHSTSGENPTCIVSHATLNETKSIACFPSHRHLIRHTAIFVGFLIIVTFVAAIYYSKLHGYRKKRNP
ncbi:cell surface glycoprotein CD200 receptor 1-B-like isoform X6 [Coturnix japonica]|uniref:cell surface glycoprotein CD200 receptor 1-B-like isoform X6 n=1 Tax=Coturnix japonica TaxID=93934 RepID=UPI000777DD3E|nr:cell surface glycoprotein CD200 receptor 1-B-like isoform X6 [Coturnix japonica]